VSGPVLDAKVADLKEILETAGKFISYTRYRNWCGQGVIYVYRYDTGSPSGVSLLASYPDRPEITNLLRGGLSPLSPTEPR